MKNGLIIILILLLTGCNSKNNISNPEINSCIPKKFENTYSYVYTTKEECVSKGNDAFIDVSENVDNTIFTYGCEEIIDECGTTWYGVYFNCWSENGLDEVTKVYY